MRWAVILAGGNGSRLQPLTTRTLCVVTRDHERYYRRELSELRPSQLIEQPANRGTAAAIAYSIARVAREDKKAVVGVYPADHHYEDIDTFRRTVDRAYVAALQRPDLLFLLGTEPDTPEVDYGWIEPGPHIASLDEDMFQVGRFWEKPSRDVLAAHTHKVAVARVPNVGWTDLGQPARVHSLLTAHGSSLAELRAVS